MKFWFHQVEMVEFKKGEVVLDFTKPINLEPWNEVSRQLITEEKTSMNPPEYLKCLQTVFNDISDVRRFEFQFKSSVEFESRTFPEVG